MYLSKLEIIGFKSFAQKVNLAFDSGISAIVGPNGCGKTNIVDAIRWVLGEQRYSALRSEKMEDVIFNGTKNRKPLGMAEAQLVIENNKGILPSEYTQVTIGRRVYRSGESEYLLNKVPCRLKDILDLFMDTGMGADAYSVIELKMVEVILSDKTDERRRLFEEAAGVTKYKHRRKAAYRKLESVQADLMRVNDIVVEVQKAVNSLERQAKKAEQYNDVRTRLKSLEIDVMEREYAQLHSRVIPLEEKLGALSADKNRIDVDLTREEERLEVLRDTLNDVEKRLAEAQRDASVQLDKIHQVEQQNLIAAERTKALRTNITRYEKEKVELHAQRQQLESSVGTTKLRIEELTARESEVADELKQRQAELQKFERSLDAKKTDLQAQKDRTIALVHEIADRQTAQDRNKGLVANLMGRATHAKEESSAYAAELGELAEKVAELTAEDRQLRRQFAEAEVRYFDAEAKKKVLKEQLDDLQRKEIDLHGEIERRNAKADFLKGLIESREGFAESVRFLSRSGKWQAKQKLTIADAVHADKKFRIAIESALGDLAGLFIVENADEAHQGISLLKEEQKGKATFVSMESLPRVQSRAALPKIEGVYGWAADIAKYDAAYAPLLRLVFDRVLVVEDAKTARGVSERFAGVRCVSLDGEMTSGVGITRGGSHRQDEGGMIGKQDQIEGLQRETALLANQLAALHRQREERAAEHDAIELKAFSDAVKNVEKEMNGVEMRIAQLEFEKKRANDIIAKNDDEIRGLGNEVAELEAIVTGAAPRLDHLREEKGEVERNVGAATQELEGLEQEWSARSRVVNELGIGVVSLKGERQNSQNELVRAEKTIADLETTLQRRDIDILSARDDIASTEVRAAENSTVVVGLRHEYAGIEARRESVEHEALHVREEMHQIELKIKDERRSHDDSVKIVHELELKIAELKAKIEHLTARAFEEFELQLALKTYPDDEFVDFAQLRDDIQSLRDRMKTLGNINFAAFEEYTSEKERFEFLSSQRDDLIEAEKTLLATIEEINQTAQKKFLDTFEKIRVNFIETFKSLFDPGDECDLRLEEGVDPLEAGIEITAKPRGKRPTSIELLSGGEKTLTAISLLFAIYLVKPSPFCILDEVDAPLDDANIDRFTRIIRKFSDNTQFIVVTHNKRTMEAANAMYGVTMEEEGVSKLVTVRFKEGARVFSAAVASG